MKSSIWIESLPTETKRFVANSIFPNLFIKKFKLCVKTYWNECWFSILSNKNVAFIGSTAFRGRKKWKSICLAMKNENASMMMLIDCLFFFTSRLFVWITESFFLVPCLTNGILFIGEARPIRQKFLVFVHIYTIHTATTWLIYINYYYFHSYLHLSICK